MKPKARKVRVKLPNTMKKGRLPSLTPLSIYQQSVGLTCYYAGALREMHYLLLFAAWVTCRKGLGLELGKLLLPLFTERPRRGLLGN
jgi:hypothetical protein